MKFIKCIVYYYIYIYCIFENRINKIKNLMLQNPMDKFIIFIKIMKILNNYLIKKNVFYKYIKLKYN